MKNQKLFRFGLVTGKGSSHADWRDKARKVEKLGYEVLLLPDHMTERNPPRATTLPVTLVRRG